MTFIQKTRAFNVDEIDGSSLLHVQFQITRKKLSKVVNWVEELHWLILIEASEDKSKSRRCEPIRLRKENFCCKNVFNHLIADS